MLLVPFLNDELSIQKQAAKMPAGDFIVSLDDNILITGANGFIGSRVVQALLGYGFKKLRCFVRPSGNLTSLVNIMESSNNSKIRVIKGNLLSHEDCETATSGVSVIYHLAAGTTGKSIYDAYMNSVVTTRNLLDATLRVKDFKRFVNVSSFTVYSNMRLKAGAILDETCKVENQPGSRGEAYCYGKVRQEESVLEYNRKYKVPYVIVRPGAVYGPGNRAITGRVGIGRFGIFLHLGGSNRIPMTYVDNCADAIALAGLKKGVEDEVFNIVDDDLPTSRQFLKMYRNNVRYFTSIYVPKGASYLVCYLSEKYSELSQGQSPPALNRKRWSADWKGNRYSNEKLKRLLGWKPRVSFDEGLRRYFEYCKKGDLTNKENSCDF